MIKIILYTCPNPPYIMWTIHWGPRKTSLHLVTRSGCPLCTARHWTVTLRLQRGGMSAVTFGNSRPIRKRDRWTDSFGQCGKDHTRTWERAGCIDWVAWLSGVRQERGGRGKAGGRNRGETQHDVFYKPLKCEVLVAQLCSSPCDPMNCSPPGSSVHGIPQARIRSGLTFASSGVSWPRDQTQVSCITGRFFTIWATREALRTAFFWNTQGKHEMARNHRVWHLRALGSSPSFPRIICGNSNVLLNVCKSQISPLNIGRFREKERRIPLILGKKSMLLRGWR